MKVGGEPQGKWLNFYELFRENDYLFNDKSTYYAMFGEGFNPITLEELEVRKAIDDEEMFNECLLYDRFSSVDKKACVQVIDGYMSKISKQDKIESSDKMKKVFDLCMRNGVSFDYDVFMYLRVIEKYEDDFFQWLGEQDKSQMTFRQALDIFERKITKQIKIDKRNEKELDEIRSCLAHLTENYDFRSGLLGAKGIVESYLKTKFPALWNRYKSFCSSVSDEVWMTFLFSLRDNDIYQYNSDKIRSYLIGKYSGLLGIENFMMLSYPEMLNEKIDELVLNEDLNMVMNSFLTSKNQSLDELVSMYFIADKYSSMFSNILEIMKKTGKGFFEILNIDNIKNLERRVILEKEVFEMLKNEVGQVKMREILTLAVVDEKNPFKKVVIFLKNSGDYMEYSSEVDDKEKKCISHPRTILQHYHAPRDYSAIDAHEKSMAILKKQVLERDDMGNFIGDVVITLEGDNCIVWCPPVLSENQIMQLPVLLDRIKKDSYEGARCSCCLAGDKMWFMVHDGKEYNLNHDDVSDIVCDIMDLSLKVSELIEGMNVSKKNKSF